MSIISTVIAAATAQVGKPYVFGAEGPSSFDCSGLMQYVYGLAGIKLPRLAHEQQNATTPVATPQPGDLVFWGKPAYHVALYIGNGKIIAAPTEGENVKVQGVWGAPSGYGRVKGSGAATAGLISTVGGAASGVTSSLSNSFVAPLLDGAKGIVMPLGFAGIGVALLVMGGYLVVKPKIKESKDKIMEAI